MSIIDKFLDVDFTRDPNYVRGYDSFGDVSLFGNYEDSTELIPESEWADRCEEIARDANGADALVSRIYDQKQEGSCVANATCQSHEIIQCLQFGRERVTHLSAISIYKAIGRSPSSGAMVSDGMKQLRDVGALPLDEPANRARFGGAVMPNTGFRQDYPAGWQAVAKQFRIDECDIINTLAGMMTALLRRQPVVVGRQGHSICYCTPIRKSGSYVAKYVNSWASNWGANGFGFDSLSQMRMSAGWAFTPRSIVRPDWLNT